MRENGSLYYYRNLMKRDVPVDRNKTVPKCRQCCYYHPDFKYRKCLFSICPYVNLHSRKRLEGVLQELSGIIADLQDV